MTQVVVTNSSGASIDAMLSQITANTKALKGAVTNDEVRVGGQALARLLANVRKLGREIVGAKSAQDAILNYLRTNQGSPVGGNELAAVSGIAEYGRRVRELRAMGYRIVNGTSDLTVWERSQLRRYGVESLKPSEYVLLSVHRRRQRRR